MDADAARWRAEDATSEVGRRPPRAARGGAEGRPGRRRPSPLPTFPAEVAARRAETPSLIPVDGGPAILPLPRPRPVAVRASRVAPAPGKVIELLDGATAEAAARAEAPPITGALTGAIETARVIPPEGEVS